MLRRHNAPSKADVDSAAQAVKNDQAAQKTANNSLAQANADLKAKQVTKEKAQAAFNQANDNLQNKTTALNDAKNTLKKIEDSANVKNTIIVPNGYTYDALENATSSSTAFNEIAKQALHSNNYVSNAIDEQEKVDITNLTDSQLLRINKFALNLINQVRQQLGETDLKLNQQVLNSAKATAQHYQDMKWSIMNKHSHDVPYLTQHHLDENIEAIMLSLDHTDNSSAKHISTFKGSDFFTANGLVNDFRFGRL